MEKIITTVYIDCEVKEHAKKNGISLGKFLEEVYIERYLDVEGKKQQIIKKQEEINNLLKEIEQINERNAKVRQERRKSFSKTELDWLKSINIMKPKWENSFKAFNNEFNRDLSIEEYSEVIKRAKNAI